MGIYPVILMAQGELPSESDMPQEKIEETKALVIQKYKEVMGEEGY